MQTKRVIFVFIAFIVLCVLIIGCGQPKIESKWRSNEINIDGKFDEWKDALAYYDENTRVSVGVMNDDRYLYICLITRNQGLAEKLMRSGLTAWFDSKGTNKKVFGVRFSAGRQDTGMPAQPKEEGPMQPPEKINPGEPPEMFREPLREIEIIGPGKEERYTTTTETAQKYGIIVNTGKLNGYFVYELKVPLVEDEQHPYAIGANMDKQIGIGFEVSGANVGMIRGMGMPGGGGMPGGRGPGGQGGGMPSDGGGMPAGEKSFQLWLTVTLSSGGAK